MTKLAPALPKGPANGLASISRELVDDPARRHLAIVVVDCKAVTTDTDTGDVEPTARIRWIEPISDDAQIDREQLLSIMASATALRTGSATLDFNPTNADPFEDFPGDVEVEVEVNGVRVR